MPRLCESSSCVTNLWKDDHSSTTHHCRPNIHTAAPKPVTCSHRFFPFTNPARFPERGRAAYQIPWLCSSLPPCCSCPTPYRPLTASPSPASPSAAPPVPDCQAAALCCCCPAGRCWDGTGTAGEVCRSSPCPCSRDCATRNTSI